MKYAQSGFNLIEVLVAMVILSIGLLGIAGLQLMGVRANQGSYLRSQAASIMQDLAERMHSNIPGVTAKAYAGFTSTAGCGAVPTICGAENGASATRCSPAQMAAYDTYVVACGMRGAGSTRVDKVSDLLPGGVVTVDCIDNATPPAVVAAGSCQAGYRHQITVRWDERVASSGTAANEQAIETQTISMMVQP